jgi:hypothetical protein
MGEGWVVMLDTLRRVDALLDRMSFLGVSSGDPTDDENITNDIVNAMNELEQVGVKKEHTEKDECQVHYSYKQFTIVVYWNEADEFTCDINNHDGQTIYSSSDESMDTLVKWIKAILKIR